MILVVVSLEPETETRVGTTRITLSLHVSFRKWREIFLVPEPAASIGVCPCKYVCLSLWGDTGNKHVLVNSHHSLMLTESQQFLY